jgi:O-antigen biosynthesis protein
MRSQFGKRLAAYLDRRKDERYVDLRRLPSDAETYRGLSRFSLRFDRVQIGPRSPAVNVLVPSARAIFAGTNTALAFARMLSVELDQPLRVVAINRRGAGRGTDTAALLQASGGIENLSLTRLGDGEILDAGPDDTWVVTHWTTAHAADIASRLGVIDPAKVIYLVQDYEPGFHPWSMDFALARATYHAGFRIVVNSRPLADYLREQERVEIESDLVFAPHLDPERLARVAAERRGDKQIGIFFYARPSKPRNLYPLGVATLRRAHHLLGADAGRCDIIAAGEPCPPIRLASERTVEALGDTGWDGYFDLLRRVHVGLSLMYSPHPSHPPLELAVSGARVVTNTFGSARDGLHPRITTARADPDELAHALVDVVRSALEDPCGPFEPIPDKKLGHSLPHVAREIVSRLR